MITNWTQLGQEESLGVGQVAAGQDDTDLVAAFLALAAEMGDEAAADLIGAGKSTLGLWRQRLDQGRHIRLKSFAMRARMRQATFSGGVGHRSYMDGALAVISEIRSKLDELERRLRGGES